MVDAPFKIVVVTVDMTTPPGWPKQSPVARRQSVGRASGLSPRRKRPANSA